MITRSPENSTAAETFLTINRPNALRQGLFGNLENGRIENIGLDRVNIRGGVNVGGVAGGIRANSVIFNSYSIGTISGNEAVGGVVGLVLDNSSVGACYSTGNVSGIMHIGDYRLAHGTLSHNTAFAGIKNYTGDMRRPNKRTLPKL
jgi:hypothetical protein